MSLNDINEMLQWFPVWRNTKKTIPKTIQRKCQFDIDMLSDGINDFEILNTMHLNWKQRHSFRR